MALVLASNPNIQEETAGSLNSRPASSKRHSPRKARTTQKNPKQTNKQTNKPSLQQKQWAGFSPSETQSNKQIYKQAHLESNPKQAINTQTGELIMYCPMFMGQEEHAVSTLVKSGHHMKQILLWSSQELPTRLTWMSSEEVQESILPAGRQTANLLLPTIWNTSYSLRSPSPEW